HFVLVGDRRGHPSDELALLPDRCQLTEPDRRLTTGLDHLLGQPLQLLPVASVERECRLPPPARHQGAAASATTRYAASTARAGAGRRATPRERDANSLAPLSPKPATAVAEDAGRKRSACKLTISRSRSASAAFAPLPAITSFSPTS